MQLPQVSDTSFPSKKVQFPPVPPSVPYFGPRLPPIPNPLSIDVGALAIYPVLSKGASAMGPQTALFADNRPTGSVETHPNTAPGGPVVTPS